KRQDARKQGQIARSRELPSVLAILGAIAALRFMAQDTIPHWTTFYRILLDSAQQENFQSTGPVLFWSSVEVFRWIVPILVSAMG
ncbi:EscU/YscU/HrcU family type III secretion system export apparatus switch protein, partial [Schaalia odontolytica]|uniref:EscU/YscU/HrcU family type III secretion system export apparatus switch protein n=1 Tax=Schaalia odontolytica TaxID=1660 RepID=UPI00210E5AEF